MERGDIWKTSFTKVNVFVVFIKLSGVQADIVIYTMVIHKSRGIYSITTGFSWPPEQLGPL